MFWGGPQDHFGMLAGFQKAVIFICICWLGVARWNYFSNMWDTRGATCVVGGRVGMDETHQVNIHFNWDNLSLYPYSLLIYSSLRAEWARKPVGFLPCLIFVLKTCIPFGAVPKKSKKRQAKTLLLKFRSTPIALAALPADFSSSLIFQFSIKNLSFRSWLSQKSRKNVKRKHVFQKFAFGCGLSLKSRKNVKRKHYFWKFGAPLSHFRPLGGIFCFLGFSNFWLKTYHSVRGCP